jgi:aryl-alcohol dehydrogenase-like predicted oxidoreductase
MQKRRLGRTGQMSTIVAFGGAAISRVSQEDANASISLALDNGVNHFDVAPSYGEAELRLAPWMKKRHDEIYLACKTEKRIRAEASHEMLRSLERLGTATSTYTSFTPSTIWRIWTWPWGQGGLWRPS